MVKYKIIADKNYKEEQRFKEMPSFFIYTLAVPWPTLGNWEYFHSTNVNHCVYWFPKPGKAPSGILTRNLPIHLQHLNPLDHSPQVRVFKMIWFVVASSWDFLTHLLYFQMWNRNYF